MLNKDPLTVEPVNVIGGRRSIPTTPAVRAGNAKLCSLIERTDEQLGELTSD